MNSTFSEPSGDDLEFPILGEEPPLPTGVFPCLISFSFLRLGLRRADRRSEHISGLTGLRGSKS